MTAKDGGAKVGGAKVGAAKVGAAKDGAAKDGGGKGRRGAAGAGAGGETAGVALLIQVAQMERAGYGVAEMAVDLGRAQAVIRRALADERMPYVRRMTSGELPPLEAARAQYRVARAREVMDESMESPDRWLRFQAAQAIIAAEERRQERTQAVEVIVSSAFLQDGPAEDAELAVLQDTGQDGQEIAAPDRR